MKLLESKLNWHWGVKQQQEMDDAAQRLESCIDPVYHPVRGENAQDLTLAPFTQNSGHPQFTDKPTSINIPSQ